jgi:ABC-2 type transport system permease protein
MILTIAGKELKTLFASPLAWIVLTAAQLVASFAFLKRIDDFSAIQPQLVNLAHPPGVTELVAAPLFVVASFVLLFATPILGMRTIAEERRNQTLIMLTSAPVSMTQIVLGKYVGLVAFLALIVLLIGAMPLSLAGSTALDYPLLGALTLGLALLAAGFAAVSIYTSSLTVHPVAAAFVAFIALILMMLGAEAAGEGLRARGWHVPAALAQVFLPMRNFESLARGIVDTYTIACSLLLAIFFLVLTVRRLDARRLRG